jgi:hypothetical protein
MAIVDISFDINNSDKTVIKTNIKEKEGIEEALSDFIRTQIGARKDESEPNKYDTYSIKIGLDLSDDSFRIESNTGNKGLTLGIIMATLKQLDNIALQPL